jgi:hypothetical protein
LAVALDPPLQSNEFTSKRLQLLFVQKGFANFLKIDGFAFEQLDKPFPRVDPSEIVFCQHAPKLAD